MEMTNSELISWFQLNYPKLVTEMKNCNHHLDEQNLNPYHLEGDVFSHVLMVLNQAKNESFLVRLACLLHDIGKPFTRQITKNNRVSFVGHEAMSAFLSLDIMEKLNLSHEDRELLFQAICYHTEPYKLTTEQLNELFRENPSLSNLVKRLSLADHYGRFTSVENEEKDFSYLFNTTAEIKSERELIILVGLPASGKSTKANLLKDGYVIVSRDSIIESMYPNLNYNEAYKSADFKEVDKELNNQIDLAAKLADKVVIDMTNLSKKRRKSLINRFKGFKVKCEVFLPPMTTIMDRASSRKNKNIQEHAYYDMIRSFYPPSFSEDIHEIIWRF